MNAAIDQQVKKTNNRPGLPPRTFYFIIGKRRITKEDEHQFAQVAIDIYFGSIVSDMYNHDIGPNVSPNTPMKKNNPNIIRDSEELLSPDSNRNPNATHPLPRAANSSPSSSKIFRPYLLIMTDVINVVMSFYVVIKVGIKSAN